MVLTSNPRRSNQGLYRTTWPSRVKPPETAPQPCRSFPSRLDRPQPSPPSPMVPHGPQPSPAIPSRPQPSPASRRPQPSLRLAVPSRPTQPAIPSHTVRCGGGRRRGGVHRDHCEYIVLESLVPIHQKRFHSGRKNFKDTHSLHLALGILCYNVRWAHRPWAEHIVPWPLHALLQPYHMRTDFHDGGEQ